jgi:hypothetical protein
MGAGGNYVQGWRGLVIIGRVGKSWGSLIHLIYIYRSSVKGLKINF